MTQDTTIKAVAGREAFSTALHTLPDPLLAVDQHGFIYYTNEAAQALLRVAPQQLPQPLDSALGDEGLARRIGQALAAGHPPDAGSGNEFLWEVDDNAWLVRIQRSGDGHVLWCSQQRPQGALQERLETEHMRRFWAAALAGVGSWTWDIRENRLRSDAILAQLTGIDDAAVPVDALFSRVHPDDLPALQDAIQEAIDSAEEEVELESEFRFLPQDGEEIWLAMRGGVIRDTDGSPLMMSGVHFDVTERKQAEQALRRAKDALQEANRAKDSFLAKVSHEIRTPLTTMLGYAELLYNRAGSEQERRNLGEILDSGRYLQSLVDDLLDLSRIIAGKVSIQPQAVDLRHLGHELLSTMNMRAAEKRLGFSLNVSAGIPEQTQSDPVRVRQILTNLIGNAVKFTEQGEVAVCIGPRNVDGAPYVAFEIRDTGPGIPTSKLNVLFQPFSQTRMSDASHGGLGLGLAISQRLAEVLGGLISVESTPGSGSTFTFLLPVIEVPLPRPERAAAQLEADSEPDFDEPLDIRVLAVDDVPSILSLLANHLTTAGAEVTTAADGLEALDKIAEARDRGETFDLVLMDLHMPHLDGPQTLQRLRESGDRTPVIALSASAMRNDRDNCLRLGFNDFVSKPFNAGKILRSIAQVMRQGGARPAARPKAVPSHERRLIVVEDHEALAELTGKQLASLGYTVETAHTAAAAIDRAKAFLPAAMVIDLTLPDMDGIELCRALRQEDGLEQCRFVAYTGMDEPRIHAQARDAGFAGVLLKPANLADFAALLETETVNG